MQVRRNMFEDETQTQRLTRLLRLLSSLTKEESLVLPKALVTMDKIDTMNVTLEDLKVSGAAEQIAALRKHSNETVAARAKQLRSKWIEAARKNMVVTATATALTAPPNSSSTSAGSSSSTSTTAGSSSGTSSSTTITITTTTTADDSNKNQTENQSSDYSAPPTLPLPSSDLISHFKELYAAGRAVLVFNAGKYADLIYFTWWINVIYNMNITMFLIL